MSASSSAITRRDMLKGAAGAAAVAGLAAGAGAAAADEAQAATYEQSVAWDAEYDVVVCGYGMAGAVSAITAADNGARVLLVEKAAHGEEGGNSRYCGQCCLDVEGGEANREGAVEYMKAIRGRYNTPEDDVIEAFIDSILGCGAWYTEHGGNPVMLWRGIGEFTDIEGWDLMDCWTESGLPWNAGCYNTLQRWIEASDAIDVWYEAPAQRLIQDPASKTVLGVAVQVGGTDYNVRARNGVVLTTGGFENNIQMIQDFHQLPYAYSKGALMNTGDGIKMAQAAGADLWHMSNIAGPDLNVINPETSRSYGYGCIGHSGNKYLTTQFADTSVILVGADGTRFADETVLPGHGFIDFHGMKLRQPVSLPAYLVFDEAAFGTTIYRQWSNQAMLENGTIVSADTLDGLTEELGLPEGSLAATVAEYNQFCDAGDDVRFHRPVQYLAKLAEEGPYYAVEVRPAYTNTQGGPRRNAQGNIVDTQGNPIPHLYSAGECGSIWGDIYQGAGNVGECFAFGRISGANAAAEKDDTERGSLLAGKAVDFAYVPEDYAAGVELGENDYLGVGYAIGGALVMKVTVEDGRITAVEDVRSNETPDIGEAVLPALLATAVELGDTSFDAITGATSTSEGFRAALVDALTQAGVEVDAGEAATDDDAVQYTGMEQE